MAAIILEKQRERISGDTLGNLPDHVKPAVDEFIERLELITGLDIDGDGKSSVTRVTRVAAARAPRAPGPPAVLTACARVGPPGMEGNDVRTQVERSATGGGSELTEEQEAEVAMWTLRLKNVEDNLREHEEAERQVRGGGSARGRQPRRQAAKAARVPPQCRRICIMPRPCARC
jgi:hypothetical protein